MIEALEARRLCRVAVMHQETKWYLLDKTLHISGSVNSDGISVSRRNGLVRLTLNGTNYTVRHAVDSAVIYGGRGNDRINFGGVSAQDMGFTAYIDGGLGNDTLQSGTSADTLLGGAGDDLLLAVNGDDYYYETFHVPDDYLDGGPGNDRMFDGGTMYGGSGNDYAGAGANLPLTSGLEEMRSNDESYGGTDGIVPRQYWPSDLFIRHGRLIFTYQTYGSYQTTLDGPFINVAGQYELHEKTTIVESGSQATIGTITKKFDLADATRRGIVMTFDPASENARPDLTVLVAAG